MADKMSNMRFKHHIGSHFGVGILFVSYIYAILQQTLNPILQ
jgi:hypothetical protein